MTFERWKDVLRGSKSDDFDNPTVISSVREVKELVLENIRLPILSAIGGFWGMNSNGEFSELYYLRHNNGIPKNRNGMLGSQNGRLGMDLSSDMLSGLKNLSCIDMFQEFFVQICIYTGLLGKYLSPTIERTSSFVESIERQSAVIITINTAKESGDIIGELGWKCVWGIIFELRDMKLLCGAHKLRKSLFNESDSDLLRPESREDWSKQLLKESSKALGGTGVSGTPKSGLFGAMGRLFGSEENFDHSREDDQPQHAISLVDRTVNGKEELVLWDDYAPSDDEDERTSSDNVDGIFEVALREISENGVIAKTVGNLFEQQLIEEDQNDDQSGPPITGLEIYNQVSPRARVRSRLAIACDFTGLISESRFLGIQGIGDLLGALIDVANLSKIRGTDDDTPCEKEFNLDDSVDKSDVTERFPIALVISPASEALAEVLICEIALKNRDRIASLWTTLLKKHYYNKLNSLKRSEKSSPLMLYPGIEKCTTGLLRICYHTIHRDDIADDVLSALKCLYHSEATSHRMSKRLQLDKHYGEGIWRICRDVDGLCRVGVEGWKGLLELIHWCATRGNADGHQQGENPTTLSEDDPSLQAFRCMSLMLNSTELVDIVPFTIAGCIRALIMEGERLRCPKLSIAGLDLLLLLYTRVQSLISQSLLENRNDMDRDKCVSIKDGSFWVTCWLPVLEGMAEASDCRYSVSHVFRNI